MGGIPEKFARAVRKWSDLGRCSDRECSRSGALLRSLSHRSTIQLGAGRFCFPACFERALLLRLQRLLSVRDASVARNHRVPLGLLMLSRGELQTAQLQKALQAQKETGSGQLGEWLLKLGFATEEQITAALAVQWRCPVLRKLPRCPNQFGVPLAILERFQMLPAYYVEPSATMYVAFAGKVEYRALLAIEEVLQCSSVPCMMATSELTAALARFRGQQVRSDLYFEGAANVEEIARISLSYSDILSGDDVRLSACGDLIWIRIKAGCHGTNLLFPRWMPELAFQSDGRLASASMASAIPALV